MKKNNNFKYLEARVKSISPRLTLEHKVNKDAQIVFYIVNSMGRKETKEMNINELQAFLEGHNFAHKVIATCGIFC